MRGRLHTLVTCIAVMASTTAFGQNQSVSIEGAISCSNGFASAYSCEGVDLVGHVASSKMSFGSFASITDIWGWTDPETGKEYALIGKHDGFAAVDISEPTQPDYVAFIDRPATSINSGWSDIKVYRDHAFFVADAAGSHGMGVIDLTDVRSASNADTLQPTVIYDEFSSAHNIAINEETGFAYVVGGSGFGATCGGGIHMVDIRNPLEPEFAGCYALETVGIRRTGYTHDVQCVVYRGPDEEYRGREVCFGSSETAITIVDVTEKQMPVTVAAASYPMIAYAHQGWLSEDHRYFFQNDELDETQFATGMRTIVWDLSVLEEPELAAVFEGAVETIDHNLFVSGNYVYEANYTSGLRILDISDPTEPKEVAFFDTTPGLEGVRFGGAWGVYPFFESGLVVVSSMNEGLFVLNPQLVDNRVVSNDPVELPTSQIALSAYPNPMQASTTVELVLGDQADVMLELFDAQGRLARTLHAGRLAANTHRFKLNAAGLSAGNYVLRAYGAGFDASYGVAVVK